MSTFRRATMRAASAALAVASVFLLATCDIDKLTKPSGTAPDGTVFDSTELALGGGTTVTLGGTATLTVTPASSSTVTLTNVVKRFYSATPATISVDSVTGVMTGVAIGTAKVTGKILAPELGDGVTISRNVRVRYKGIKVTAPIVTDSIVGIGLTKAVSLFGVNNSSVQQALALTADSLKSRDTTVFTVGSALVTAKKNGTALLVAFFDGFADSVAVRVRQVAKTITFPTTDYTARHVNFNLTVPVIITDQNNAPIPTAALVTWSTKDTTKAVIGSATGVLKMKSVTTDSLFAAMDGIKSGQKIVVAQAIGSLSKFQGDARSDTVAKNVTVVPTVTALDSGSTPIVGTTVTFKTGLGLNASVIDTLPVTTDAQGRAKPTSWKIGDVAGSNNNTLIATSGAQTTTFTVSGVAGAAKKLGFSVQPTSALVGASVAPSIVVQIQDSLGNLISTATNTVTLALSNNPGAATLGGTLSQPAVAGLATFNNISLNAAGSGYALQASSGALTSAISNGFDAFGVKTKVAFSTQPSSGTAGATMSTVRVQVQDAGSNRVATAIDTVTLAIGNNAGGVGTALSGTVKAAAVAGVATFSNLSLNNAGTGYTLTAAAAGLSGATSSAFNMAAVGVAAKVAFVSQPSNVVSGAVMAPSFSVQILDASGALVTTSAAQVTLSIDPTTNPTGLATVSGTPTVGASGGVASFTNVIVNRAGTGYKFIATVTGLTTATSNSFNVTAGTATKLGFFQGPTHTVVSTTMTPAVVVEVQDANGNRVTTGATAVSLAVGNCSGTLTGGGAATTANGIATYSGLSVSTAVNSCVLNVTTTAGLTAAGSNSFNIVAVGGAVKLKFTTQPSSATAGVALNAGTVAIQDVNGANVASASASVSIAVAVGPTTSFSGTVNATASPTTSFTSNTFNTAGTYQLVATATGYRPDTSTVFTITPAAAARANLLAQPGNSVAGVPFSAPVQAVIQDNLGNTVTTASNVITLSNAGTLNNGLTTISATAVNGVATFNGLAVRKAGTALLFCAAATGLSTFCSGKTFDIAAAPLSALVFNVQPSTVTSATAFTTSPQVSGQDSVGNTLTDFTGNVTVALVGGTAGAVFTGAKTQPAVAGVATFPSLSIDKSGTGYQLSASASGVNTGTSNAFAVNFGAAAKLGWVVQPAATTFFNAPLGAAGTTTALAVQDGQGNTVTNDFRTITFAVAAGPSTTFRINGATAVGGTLSMSAGLISFTSNNQLGLLTAGSGYQIQATASGLLSATTNAFTVAANDVKSKLAWNNNPQNGSYKISLLGPTSTTPNVFVVDQWNNLIGTATDNITVTLANDAAVGSTLTGGGSTAAAGGGSSFPNLQLNKAGNGFTLQAAATGLTSATSTSFNITVPGEVSTLSSIQDQTLLGTTIYFVQGNALKSVSVNGGTVTTITASTNALAVTNDGTNVYWAEQGASNSGDAFIKKLALPSGTITTLTTAQTDLVKGNGHLYTDGTNVYFAARNIATTATIIKSVSVSASSAAPTEFAGSTYPSCCVQPFTVAGGFIYFSDNGTLKRMTTAGASITTLANFFVFSTPVVAGTTLYFNGNTTGSAGGNIYKIDNPTTSGLVTPTFLNATPSTNIPWAMASDGSNFYILDNNGLTRCALGTLTGCTTLSSSPGNPSHLAFDATEAYYVNGARLYKIGK